MLSAIFAVSDNGIIGVDGKLPWRCPDDVAHFKRTTMGKPVIMGRKTWQSLGAALPGRDNIVVSRSLTCPPAAAVAKDVGHALWWAQSSGPCEAMLLGGAEIFRMFDGLYNVAYRTVVHVDVDDGPGVVRFDLDMSDFKLSREEAHETHTFQKWVRR